MWPSNRSESSKKYYRNPPETSIRVQEKIGKAEKINLPRGTLPWHDVKDAIWTSNHDSRPADASKSSYKPLKGQITTTVKDNWQYSCPSPRKLAVQLPQFQTRLPVQQMSSRPSQKSSSRLDVQSCRCPPGHQRRTVLAPSSPWLPKTDTHSEHRWWLKEILYPEITDNSDFMKKRANDSSIYAIYILQ